MTLFFITFLALYFSMHAYLYLRIRGAFSLNKVQWTASAVWALLMIFAPFFIRYAEKAGLEHTARGLSYIGYLWMGALFLFIAFSLFFDLIKALVIIWDNLWHQNLIGRIPRARGLFLLTVCIVLVICSYGYYEARHIRVEKITIRSDKLPADRDRIRIAQISDVHLGLIVREGRLNSIISKVKQAAPDILVSTGDLVDGQLNELDGLSDLFKEINPALGKFAVTGNHEFYAGLDQAISFTEKAGFLLLRGKAVTVGNGINIVGVDDRTAERYGIWPERTEQEILSGVNNSFFTLLLKHRPRVLDDSTGLFDVQLSGHTHKGQIFPFSLLTSLYFPHNAGFLSLPKGSHLYVSRGTGTWGPPVRFLSPPEITLIDIVPSARAVR